MYYLIGLSLLGISSFQLEQTIERLLDKIHEIFVIVLKLK